MFGGEITTCRRLLINQLNYLLYLIGGGDDKKIDGSVDREERGRINAVGLETTMWCSKRGGTTYLTTSTTGICCVSCILPPVVARSRDRVEQRCTSGTRPQASQSVPPCVSEPLQGLTMIYEFKRNTNLRTCITNDDQKVGRNMSGIFKFLECRRHGSKRFLH